MFQSLLPYTLATDIGTPGNEFNRITTEITPLRFKKNFFDPQKSEENCKTGNKEIHVKVHYIAIGYA